MEEVINQSSKIALTVKEAAEALSISPPTLYELMRTGDFPAFKIGRRTLISRSGLEMWVAAQTVQNINQEVRI